MAAVCVCFWTYALQDMVETGGVFRYEAWAGLKSCTIQRSELALKKSEAWTQQTDHRQ